MKQITQALPTHTKLLIFIAVVVLTSIAYSTQTLANEDSSVTADVTTQSININSASAEELSTGLLGIGEKKAQAIIAYRNTYGEFLTIDDLLKVKGIGEKTLEKNRSRIML